MTTFKSELLTAKKVIPLQEKLAILKQVEAGASRRDVELMFKCSQSAICRIVSSKEDILQEAESGIPARPDPIFYKGLEIALSRWANELNECDSVITVTMAREKATELSLAMGLNLTPSSGWLYRWKEKANIQFAKRTNDPEKILNLFLNESEKNELLQTRLRNHCSTNSATKSKKKTLAKPEPGEKKEKTFLTLLQKFEIIQRIQNGERKSALIKEYNMSKSAMWQIVKDKTNILKLASDGRNLQMRFARGGILKDGEADLNSWVREKMENGESLKRNDIKLRAKEIAKRLNIDFKASEGWLRRWKARMNLYFNENETLMRKVPTYIKNYKKLENTKELTEQTDSLYVQQYIELPEYEIKEEQIDNDISDEMEDVESSEEFIYNDESDVKLGLLTP